MSPSAPLSATGNQPFDLSRLAFSFREFHDRLVKVARTSAAMRRRISAGTSHLSPSCGAGSGPCLHCGAGRPFCGMQESARSSACSSESRPGCAGRPTLIAPAIPPELPCQTAKTAIQTRTLPSRGAPESAARMTAWVWEKGSPRPQPCGSPIAMPCPWERTCLSARQAFGSFGPSSPPVWLRL